jgi:hypothetical protein
MILWHGTPCELYHPTACEALMLPSKILAWWLATLSQEPAVSAFSHRKIKDQKQQELTEVVSHEIPEVEQWVHFRDV